MDTPVCACAPCLHGLWATVICTRCKGEGYLSVFGIPRADVTCGGCRGTGRVDTVNDPDAICHPCQDLGCDPSLESVQCQPDQGRIDAELAEAALNLLDDANAACDKAETLLDGVQTLGELRDAQDVEREKDWQRDERLLKRSREGT